MKIKNCTAQCENIVLNVSHVLLVVILTMSLVGCSSGSTSSGKTSTAALAASGTSPELAKEILSRYGYSIQEYWQILDRARTEGNMYFMPITSQIRALVDNCVPVITTTEILERIELVDSTEGVLPVGACKVEFLYERTTNGTAADKTFALKMIMRLKDPSNNAFYHFQALACTGVGNGSEAPSNANVTYSSQCHMIDNFYGEFQTSYSTQINVLNDNVKILSDITITTAGRPAEYMSGGVALVRYEYNTAPQGFTLNFNGESSTAIASPGWLPGLRTN